MSVYVYNDTCLSVYVQGKSMALQKLMNDDRRGLLDDTVWTADQLDMPVIMKYGLCSIEIDIRSGCRYTVQNDHNVL